MLSSLFSRALVRPLLASFFNLQCWGAGGLFLGVYSLTHLLLLYALFLSKKVKAFISPKASTSNKPESGYQTLRTEISL